MLLIPAIDLKNGQCVRLRQGRMDDATIFADDPVAMAERLVTWGAKRLHIVDLNGAFAGVPVNNAAISAIAKNYPHIPIQVGGGIRDMAIIGAYLEAGISYAIIGTQAIKNPQFVANACTEFPGRIIVGLDAKDGLVAINGWATVTELKVTEVAKNFEQVGVMAIIYTDIGRDGMLTGPNITATCALADAVQIPIIASGGISNIQDIQALAQTAHPNILGAITGRAIYEGTLDFAAGQRIFNS
jgi:phosphoribosylformimino-5-aminoimidazole carboxamide ribotide isomerase